MKAVDIIVSTIFSLIAAGTFIIGVFHLKERGPLLNNAFLFASEEERRTMDKKPCYRQSGIVFCLLGIVVSLLAMEFLLQTGWLFYIMWAVIGVVFLYALLSSVKK